MKKSSEYLMKNLTYEISTLDWIWYVKNHFGEEEAEKFCDYVIKAREILDTQDIRTLLHRYTLSVYWAMEKEQIAFISIYKPINREEKLITSLENGLEKAQKLYRQKNKKLAEKIKKLGYSYETINGNWKDKNEKDTYQRESIFAVYSEKDTNEQFQKNITETLKEYDIKSVIITKNIIDNSPRAKIPAKQIDVETKETIKEYENITISDIEKNISNISSAKFEFKIPYEKNKKILEYKAEKIGNHYSKNKQEKIKKAMPQSFNMAMLKQALINSFEKQNYNN